MKNSSECKKICMVVPQTDVKGGIATVVNGYREYGLGKEYSLSFVESYRDGSKWQKLGKAISGYFKFAVELLFRKPDVVHVHSSFGPSFYRKIPFILMTSWRGIKLVNHIHGAEFEDFYVNVSPKKRELIKKIYNKCDVLIVLSGEWKDKISTIVTEDRIQVIENYCHIPKLQEGARKKQILFLGELGERKGCFDIPEIYKKVVNEVGNIPLVMAGAGEVETIKKMLEERSVLENVSFPGWIRGEVKEKFLQESRYFLFPSYNEGMPMAVLEAMAYGMGIVTSNAGGIPKLVEDGVSGYICVPGDIDTISRKLIELIQKEECWKKCSFSARKKAIEQYSYDSHVEKLKKMYNSIS